MTEARVDTVLIASGGGTDAYSIMQAYTKGFIPNIEIQELISTSQKAGCLEKASVCKIRTYTLEKKYHTIDEFNANLSNHLRYIQTELVFLVGCVVKVYPIDNIAMYNIHPADQHKHGGNKMYGLEVHRRVIREVEDKICRGKKTASDRFYTYPTIHEATMDYDAGHPLLIGHIEIPKEIISEYMANLIDIDEAAKRLQKHVLPYEWLMLPTAVQMAAKKIIDKKEAP